MAPKTLMCLILASLAATTLAAAEEAPHAAGEARLAAHAPPFGLRLENEARPIAPGGATTFVVHAKAAEATTLTLSIVRHEGDGFSFDLSPATLDVPAGGEAMAKLVVSAGANVTGRGAVEVVATDGANATRVVVAHFGVERGRDGEPKGNQTAPPPRPPPPPKPRPEPRPEPPMARPANGSMLGRGIELSIEGFGAGGLRIELRLGDGNVLHLDVGADALRAAKVMVEHGDARAAAHGRLWLRLQAADDGTLAPDPAANG